jgi:hypothetical protein
VRRKSSSRLIVFFVERPVRMFGRTRYQQGMLSRVKCKYGPDCWAFRSWDIDSSGKRVRRTKNSVDTNPMQIGLRQYVDLLLKLSLSASLAACITRRAVAAPQAKSKTNVSTNKSSPPDLPDGTLDLSDLWPSPLQPAVESDTLALQPTLSVAG